MKLNSIRLISSLVAAACTVQVQGAPPASEELAPIVVQGQRSATATGEVDGPVSTFAELIDQPVRNYQNEKLGHIKAITVDLERGRVVEVLVSSGGGMLGLNGKITALPPSVLKYDAAHETAWINVSKARFDAAPALARANAATYSQTDRAIAASRYFGVKPWFEHGGLGYVQTTDELNLMQIKDPQGRYLGKIGLIMLDLPTGRIRQVVNDMETMHGDGSFTLAPTALHYNASHTGLVLNDSYASLTNAPHFRWMHGNGNDTHFVEQTNASRQVYSKVTTTSRSVSRTQQKVAARTKDTARTRQIAAE